MKIKEIKEYINDPSTTIRDVFALHRGLLSDAGDSNATRRASKISANKGWNVLKWAEKRFGKKWWE